MEQRTRSVGEANAAVIYSVLGTCALVQAPPVAYLTDVLARIADGWPYSRVRELLPDAWVEERRARDGEAASEVKGPSSP